MPLRVTFTLLAALVVLGIVIGAVTGVWWIGTAVAVIAWAVIVLVYRARLRRG
jgi:hypothetical protein